MENTCPTPADLFEKQSRFFASGKTKDIDFRRQQIETFLAVIKKNRKQISEALWKDFRKSATGAYTGELLIILKEAEYVLDNLDRWTAPKKEKSPLFLPATKSMITREPYGSILIMTPYNVPFVGTFTLLLGAIAAGNCAVVKMSEIAEHSAAVAIDIIRQAFPEEYIAAVTGDKNYSEQLLAVPFDFFFFMGSTEVGKAVMTACAKHLAPLSLQLGGKCPAIIDTTTNIRAAAKRIAWGKFLNAGQECVSVDHVYVPTEKKDLLITALKEHIRSFYGENPQKSPDYERIVNERHFDRIARFLQEGTIVAGGTTDRSDLYIEPTIIDAPPRNTALAEEEIFGPILRIFTYDTPEDLLLSLKKSSSPLVVYIFSNDTDFQQNIINQTVSGSVCINDVMVHNASVYVPVGGVGRSGFGRMHGRYTFEMFSRFRTIMKRNLRIDLPGRYPPANEAFLPFMEKFLG